MILKKENQLELENEIFELCADLETREREHVRKHHLGEKETKIKQLKPQASSKQTQNYITIF